MNIKMVHPISSPIQGANNKDTSVSRSGDVLRELKKIRNDAANQGAIEFQSEVRESSYLTDRPNYRASQVIDTQEEVKWKQVESREQQVAQARQNQKKLNII